MKRFLSVILACLLLALGAGGAQADYYSSLIAVRVGDAVILTEELEAAMLRHQIRAALSCAANGYGYDITDSLNIIDAMSKVLFDLEYAAFIRGQAAEMGVSELSAGERARAFSQAREQWRSYRQIVRSENGMAFLPAGSYTSVPDDPEGNITRYLESWGLTEYVLFEAACDALLAEKLFGAVTAGLSDADEEAKDEYYDEWFWARWEEASIYEDALAVAEVCLRLKP